MERVLIQLGRIGDVINVLPLAEEYKRNDKRLNIMVASEFADLLSGVSYCDSFTYNGDYAKLLPAEALANSLCKRVRTSQVYGLDYSHLRTSENFERDSWDRLKFGHRFDQLSLIFDRRDEQRESTLIEEVLDWTGKRVVLLSLHSHSSPFKSELLVDFLKRNLPDDCLLVDISNVQAHRVYDLLGLFDRAECLVTVDTASLHLAAASSVPVIALVNPSPWLASSRRANHILHLPYPKADPAEILKAILSTQKPMGELRHVYSDYPVKTDSIPRTILARSSWDREYRCGLWGAYPCPGTTRSSLKLIGDERNVPYVRDLIEFGFAAAKANDIVVLTNSDVGFTPGMSFSLKRLVAAKGACFCYRRDFDSLEELPSRYDVLSSKFYGGLDLFAFTKPWWEAHKAEAPDMLTGCPHWDLVYRDLIKKHGGGELYGAVWHETHEAYWKTHPTSKGNMYNLNLANLWRTTNDPSRVYKK